MSQNVHLAGSAQPGARCLLCPRDIPTVDLLEHLRLLHPAAYGHGPMQWPDGSLVVVDTTLEPAEFGGAP